MASSNAHTDAAKLEQITTEFFPKSLQIILESRSPYMSSRNFSGEQTVSSPSSSTSSSSSARPRDKWFNLALRESPAAHENLHLWQQNYLEPMVVDVVLVQRPIDWSRLSFSPRTDFIRSVSSKEQYPFCWNSDEEFGCDAKSEKIVERWLVQYESRRSTDIFSSNRRPSNTLHTFYKKTILLLRSLYSTVRLLPAYKIFRDLNSSRQICTYTLTQRVSSFAEPFTRKDEAGMQRFVFTPVEASCGRLCISVSFRSSVSDVCSESSTPMSPQFIPDYVGSPLAEPLKRFPSLPIAHGSTSSLPFSRRHSWSYDHYKASPPSFSFSPSPNYSEPHASTSHPNSRHLPHINLPPHPPESSSVHKKNASFDEYSPSSNFTPSPSPSPPIFIPESNLSKALLRSGSAPVCIPANKLASYPSLFSKHNVPPSPPLKGKKSGNYKTDGSPGLVPPSATVEKFSSLGKDDARKYFGSQISYSRSPSRSFQDDFDVTGFPCAFDVEEDDMTDPGSRPESFDQKGLLSEPLETGAPFLVTKSPDAAVGALFSMLKKAPALHQDFSGLVDSTTQDTKTKIWSGNLQEHNQTGDAPATFAQAAAPSLACSGLVASKTTADALQELQGYRRVKDLLLSQASRSDIMKKSTSKT